MLGFMRKCLSVVFRPGDDNRTRWKSLDQLGSENERLGFYCLTGLSSNGAFTLRRVARTLHRSYAKRVDVWQHNLPLHTGYYSDFRRSRVWHWIGGAASSIGELLARHPEKRVRLMGYSTGAIVLMVAADVFTRIRQGTPVGRIARLALRFASRFPLFAGLGSFVDAAHGRAKIDSIVAVVPAIRLRSRIDEMLLTICLGMYYACIPFSAVLSFIPLGWFGFPILAIAALDMLVLSRIWVPSGDSLAALRESGHRALGLKSLLAPVSCFYCGLAPIALLIAAFTLRPYWTFGLYSVFLVSLIIPILWEVTMRHYGATPDAERAMGSGYLWVPVIATAHLMILQLLGQIAVRRLSIPVLFVLAKDDAVVDNRAARRAYARIRGAKELIDVPGLGHSGWSDTHKDGVLDCVLGWYSRTSDAPVSGDTEAVA